MVGASVSQSEMGVVVEEGIVVRWLRLVAGTVVVHEARTKSWVRGACRSHEVVRLREWACAVAARGCFWRRM